MCAKCLWPVNDPVPSALDGGDGPPLAAYWCGACDAECEGTGLCADCTRCAYCERAFQRDAIVVAQWDPDAPERVETLCMPCAGAMVAQGWRIVGEVAS